MSKRLIAAVATLLVFAAACGKESDEADLTTGRGTSAPTTTSGPAASAAAAASAAPGTTRNAPEATSQAAAPASKPVTKAPEGKVNPPKDGKYVYTLKGEASDPFNPAGPPQRFDGELTKQVSHKGNVYTEEQTTSESAGRNTTRTRWEATRVLLLSFKAETPAGDFSCTLNPPLVVVKFPVKPERYPTQQIKGQGNACNGTLDITVERKETAKDATGRNWSTWRARVKLVVSNDQFKNTSDQTQWSSPDIGTEIRTSGKTQGEVKTATGSQKFQSTETTALKSRP